MTPPRPRTRARVLTVSAVALTASIALSGCSGASTRSSGGTSDGSTDGDPVTVSSCGHDVTVDRAPTRVVVGNENTLQTLDALGVGDAVHGYVLGPDDGGTAPADIPKGLVQVSSTTIPAREPVIAAKPDLFLSFNEAQLTTQGSLSYEDLQGIGANAYVLGAYCGQSPADGSIDTVYTDIDNLGKIFDVTSAADRLNQELRGRVATAKESLGGSTATVADLKVAGGTVYAIGGYPFSAITGSLGLQNEFGDLPTPFAELSAEQALAMDPDIVFVNYVGDEQAAIDAVRTALPDLPAVKAGRVYGLDESGPQGGGVGVIDSVEAVATDVRSAAV